MADSPLNSPADLRDLIIYDIHQWKTTAKSYEIYEQLCEVLEKEAISYVAYEYWFNRYLKENYYSSNNGRTYRVGDLQVCILADVIDGRSTENSYRDLCEAFGNDKIVKGVHHNRYDHYHFEALQHSLIMAERSVNTTLPDTYNDHDLTFSNLPEDVITEIVDRCDLKSYLNLRIVSHSLQTIVDRRPPPCTDIDIIVRDDYIQLKANKEILVDSCPIELTNFRHCSLYLIEKRVLRDLEALLKNPKLRLKSFRFDSNSSLHHTHWNNVMDVNTATRNYYMLFLKMLDSLNSKIHAEQCTIKSALEKHVKRILQCFKPGTLKKLELNHSCLMSEMNRIVKTDQWKLAKHLKLHGFIALSAENFIHFSTFDVQTISMNDLGRLCENLSQSINFESCNIETTDYLDIERIKNALTPRPSAAPGSYYIPNSNLVIQFSIGHSVNKIFIRKL
ncbi:hypothetical protein CRE_30019 [Caenorhabditis remanei]|uniref:F-box domain-containing protein n=1 Tax=Caenorhabditis remanei TaxID=31234 RepID=E3MM81_CAERE|nr:hypothetical protein CRE_30019 [Caenorhabditis remanei]